MSRVPVTWLFAAGVVMATIDGVSTQFPLVHVEPVVHVAHAPLLQYCVGLLHCPVVQTEVVPTINEFVPDRGSRAFELLA